MTHLDLFSGIGGFALGLRMAGGFETVAFCESDKFCHQVLNRHWPDVPIFDDIKTLKGTDVGTIGIVTGGAPCQPFSVAGKQGGTADNRYLWPEMFRVIQETNPNWVIFENVPGIINMALEQVLSDLESEGYGTETFIVPACGVNAPHRRNRVWVVAHAVHRGCINGIRATPNPYSNGEEDGIPIKNGACHGAGILAHANSQWEQQQGIVHRQEREWVDNGSHSMADADVKHDDDEPYGTGEVRRKRGNASEIQGFGDGEFKPHVGRSSDGLSPWMDGDWERGIPRVARGVTNRSARLKALGNSVVPQIVAEIGRIIQLVEKQHDR